MKDDNPLYPLSILLTVLLINNVAGSYAIYVYLCMVLIVVVPFIICWIYFDLLGK